MRLQEIGIALQSDSTLFGGRPIPSAKPIVRPGERFIDLRGIGMARILPQGNRHRRLMMRHILTQCNGA